MAILFNNQGLVKNEFRAGLALVRVAESSVTAIVYFHLGLFVAESQNLLLVIIRGVMVGIPLGAYVIRRLDDETFRRPMSAFAGRAGTTRLGNVGFLPAQKRLPTRGNDGPLSIDLGPLQAQFPSLLGSAFRERLTCW